MKEIFRRNPLDKDLFFARGGDLYQVITNVHPAERVVALRKYYYHSQKPQGVFIWQSAQYPGFYCRSIPAYSAQDATKHIVKSHYSQMSKVFGVPMIEVPWSEIQTYIYPEQGLQEWLGNKQATEWGKDVTDIVTQFKLQLNIDEKSMGITGSLLWGAQHDASDIDLVIYGSENALRFIKDAPKLLKESSSIHRPPPEFIKRYANTLTKKTGLNPELTQQYITKKLYYLYYKNKFLSVGFVPDPGEVSRKYETYSFCTMMPIKVKARILDDRLGYFYPGEYKIKAEEIAIPGTTSDSSLHIDVVKNLTTLLLMEREISGYYFPGDEVEIRGLLQVVNDGSQKYYQVIIGTQELYGRELVRVLT